ncbi:MAG: glycosyltransferase family 2 protein [Candidatus Brachytrichaceae bacterium NZ_4S206]
MTSKVDVSVILVSWNTRDLVVECLKSIPEALGDIYGDVWVVDNASTDATVETLRKDFPAVHLVINQRNVGFSAANNQAIVASSGRYVLLLNSDTVAAPVSIAHLVRFADEQPRAGVVGPMLLNPDGSFQSSFCDFPSFTNELLSATGIGRRLINPDYPGYDFAHAQTARRVGYVAGACMLVRREAIEQVGLMDESYFMYSEEVDWCYRMWKAGWEVWFTPEAKVIHHGGQSTRQWRHAMLRSLYRSKVHFFRKHYGEGSAFRLQMALFLVLQVKWLLARFVLGDIGPAIRWRDLNDREPRIAYQPALSQEN